MKNSTLWQKPKKWFYFGIPLGALIAFIGGIIFWGGFNTVLALTNTEEFCISCHEMEATVYQEYKESPHANPQSGVAATCPDCHVPRAFIPKMIRKIQASNELWHKMLGTIDTPEKFESHREALAERVWASMKKTDSRECRNCHTLEKMNLELQGKRARKKHDPARLAKSGKTCIDCHQGIAHNLPE